MINKILEIIAKEDTFKLFSNSTSPSIFDAHKKRIRTINSLNIFLNGLFQGIIDASSPESLYWNEAYRMLNFTKRLFKEIEELNRESNINDDIVDAYIESISDFVEDLDIDIIHKQISFIIS